MWPQHLHYGLRVFQHYGNVLHKNVAGLQSFQLVLEVFRPTKCRTSRPEDIWHFGGDNWNATWHGRRFVDPLDEQFPRNAIACQSGFVWGTFFHSRRIRVFFPLGVWLLASSRYRNLSMFILRQTVRSFLPVQIPTFESPGFLSACDHQPTSVLCSEFAIFAGSYINGV